MSVKKKDVRRARRVTKTTRTRGSARNRKGIRKASAGDAVRDRRGRVVGRAVATGLVETGRNVTLKNVRWNGERVPDTPAKPTPPRGPGGRFLPRGTVAPSAFTEVDATHLVAKDLPPPTLPKPGPGFLADPAPSAPPAPPARFLVSFREQLRLPPSRCFAFAWGRVAAVADGDVGPEVRVLATGDGGGLPHVLATTMWRIGVGQGAVFVPISEVLLIQRADVFPAADVEPQDCFVPPSDVIAKNQALAAADVAKSRSLAAFAGSNSYGPGDSPRPALDGAGGTAAAAPISRGPSWTR